jgi:acetyl esterase/lipase
MHCSDRVSVARLVHGWRRYLVAAMLLAGAGFADAQRTPVPFSDVADSARHAPAADLRVSYGSAAAQFAELRLPHGAGPHGAGPHPVVFLLHGGCWLNAYGVDHVAGAAESLRQRGFAVFAVEYRRVGDAGAGDPGTFDDVRTALDSLRALAPRHALDLTQLVLMGHSAGGHLALRLGSEPGVRVRGIVSLAGVTDLAAFVAPSGCGAAVARLMGGSPEQRRAQYTAASPSRRPAPDASTSVVLVIADDDRIVPAAQAEAYAARVPGARIVRVGGGHFDLVAPWTPAWSQVLDVTHALLRAPARE